MNDEAKTSSVDVAVDPLLGTRVAQRYDVQRRLFDAPLGPVYEAWDGIEQRFLWLLWFTAPLEPSVALRVRQWSAEKQREFQNGVLPRFAVPSLGLCEEEDGVSGILFAPVTGERALDRPRPALETVRLIRQLGYQVAQRSAGLSLQSLDERTTLVSDGALVLLGEGLQEIGVEHEASCRAPEVAVGSQWVTPAADVYALATLALRLLPSPTGQPAPIWQTKIEDAIRLVLGQSSSKDPSARARSLSDLDAQLADALAPKVSAPVAFATHAPSKSKEWSPLAVAGVVLGIPLFLCLVGGGICLLFGQVATP